MTNWCRRLGNALLEVLLPVVCRACGETVSFATRGAPVDGLRWCDAPVLCRDCAARVLTPAPLVGIIGADDIEVTACGGMPTCAELVDVVSAWKYHGRRGLAWPLAELAGQAWDLAVATGGEVDRLVPVPLHGRRLRERGFNQADVLARLLGQARGVAVSPDLARRTRATAQQAKLASRREVRDHNVRGVFAARARSDGEAGRVGLIDDLVTSGATATALAASLDAAGWHVSWVLAPGLATDRQYT